MSNKSNWKNWEAEVAEALGGKRRHRTMGSFATVATDVRFSKKLRKKYPHLHRIMVECKKRRKLDVPALFAEATVKYGGKDNQVILATKRPVGRFGKKKVALKKRIEHRYRVGGPVWKGRVKYLKARIADLPKKPKNRLLSKASLKELEKHLKKDCRKQVNWETRNLRAKMSNTGLVTVTLEYFAELFQFWRDHKGGS